MDFRRPDLSSGPPVKPPSLVQVYVQADQPGAGKDVDRIAKAAVIRRRQPGKADERNDS